MIPSFEELFLPILRELADGKEHLASELRDRVATETGVTAEDRKIYLPSGRDRTYDNRVGWAVKNLRVAGLVRSPAHGVYQITSDGADLLASAPGRLDRKFLIARYPAAHEYYERVAGKGSENSTAVSATSASSRVEMPPLPSTTPLQRLEEAHAELIGKTKVDLVSKMELLDDRQFEVFIARLLPRLGYGNDVRDILREHGGSGDGGIDGVVKLDTLGAERVYIQAKHWKGKVDLAPLTEFEEKVRVSGVRAGVFVALTGFDRKAEAFAKKHSHNIAWIDADDLAEAMISKGVGVVQDGSYEILRVDDDYFDLDSD